MRRRILVNATTLVVGGGIQVGYSFIERAIRRDDFEFLYMVSSQIFDLLPDTMKKMGNLICVGSRPSPLIAGMKSRSYIREIEKKFKPDIVYSIGFPSYVKFKSREIGRYTNPMETNPTPLPWKVHGSKLDQLKIYLGVLYRQYWAKNAAYIETQTVFAKNGISGRVGYPMERIKVIPNSANDLFVEEGSKILDIDSYLNAKKDNFIFCLAAAYQHKNIDIVPYVADQIINKMGVTCKFLVTLPFDSDIWRNVERVAKNMGVHNHILNLGKIDLNTCVEWYKKSKVVFMPTLLEVFSATYIEAMHMRVPVVASDLYFAREVCKEGAAYFDPDSPEDAAIKIARFISDKNEYKKQCHAALNVVKTYPTNEEKYDYLFDWLKEVANA